MTAKRLVPKCFNMGYLTIRRFFRKSWAVHGFVQVGAAPPISYQLWFIFDAYGKGQDTAEIMFAVYTCLQSWLSCRYQVTRGQTTEGSCLTLRRNTTQIFWRIWATPVSWSSTTPLELWCRLARNVSTRQLLLFTIIRYHTIVPSYCDIVHRAPS